MKQKAHSSAENPYPVFSTHVAKISDVLSLEFPSKFFTLLLCADYDTSSVSTLSLLADRLMDLGNMYFCAWGPGCEKAHDIYDEELVRRNVEKGLEHCVMTTWHDYEPMEEAVWFVLFAAAVTDEYWDECSTVVVTVGSHEWRDCVEANLSDIAAFNDRLTEMDA
jgi:hypothetical protein